MNYERCVNTTGDARRDGRTERLPSATAPLKYDQRQSFAGIVPAKPKLKRKRPLRPTALWS